MVTLATNAGQLPGPASNALGHLSFSQHQILQLRNMNRARVRRPFAHVTMRMMPMHSPRIRQHRPRQQQHQPARDDEKEHPKNKKNRKKGREIEPQGSVNNYQEETEGKGRVGVD